MATPTATPSIEITTRDLQGFAQVRERLQPETRVSIAYLPKDEPSGVIEAAKAVAEAGFLPVPHIPARRIASSAALQDFLARLAGETGTRDVFVIAGDPAKPAGGFSQSLDILKDGILTRLGYRTVGFAGHPEGHPDVDEQVLLDALRAKLEFASEAGLATEIVTQFCFDPDRVETWLGKVRTINRSVLVRVGIPGPTDATTLIKFAARCGVGASKSVLKKYGLSLSKLFTRVSPDSFVASIERRVGQADRAVAFHVYPFGGLTDSADWIDSYVSRSPMEEIGI